MNKAELVAAVAEKAEISKKDAEAAVKAFTDVIAEELKKGEKVQLVGFGTFEVSERAARVGRNPQTKQEIKIPASKAPKFKAGKALKDSLNYFRAYVGGAIIWLHFFYPEKEYEIRQVFKIIPIDQAPHGSK